MLVSNEMKSRLIAILSKTVNDPILGFVFVTDVTKDAVQYLSPVSTEPNNIWLYGSISWSD